MQLERKNEELTRQTDTNSLEINRLREDNEVLVGVNIEYGYENDKLKDEVNELKQKLEQYRLHSSFDSLESIDEDQPTRSTKRHKSSKSGKKPVRLTNDLSSESSKDDKDEQVEP